MTPAKKKSKRAARVKRRPVPIPERYQYGAVDEHTRARAAAGDTSIRLSKATRELLEELSTASLEAAGIRWHRVGLDELLYWDALDRLGRLPAGVKWGTPHAR